MAPSAVLPLRRRDVQQYDDNRMASLLDAVGLGRHAPAFAAQQVNGECFVEVVEREFVEDLDMPAGDAAFLVAPAGLGLLASATSGLPSARGESRWAETSTSDTGDEPLFAAKGAFVSDGDSTVPRRGDEACLIFAATARRIVRPRLRAFDSPSSSNASNISPQRKRPPPPSESYREQS